MGRSLTQLQRWDALLRISSQIYFAASPYQMEENLFVPIEPKVRQDDNLDFCKIPDEMEVLSAIKLMNANSAPGNDGYTGHFYIACWEIIKTDVCAFVKDFFLGAYIPNKVNSTTLVLIPKVEHARNIGDFTN